MRIVNKGRKEEESNRVLEHRELETTVWKGNVIKI